MDANSIVEIEDLELLKELEENLSGQEILDRINCWKNYFFKFDKGDRSTRSKLLEHEWYTNQTEISTNVIFKSPKYFNTIFDQLLAKHYTVGLPDRVSTIFGYKNKPKSKIKNEPEIIQKFMNGFRISDINSLLNNLSKTSKINYELQKYIVRGLVKKIKKSNFYRVTKEGWKYITICLFQNNWFANPV